MVRPGEAGFKRFMYVKLQGLLRISVYFPFSPHEMFPKNKLYTPVHDGQSKEQGILVLGGFPGTSRVVRMLCL